MLEATVPILTTWQNFYVIIGTAAATLTGLTFVAVTLIAQRQSRMPDEANAAFATPTVVHLGAALLIAAIFAAPWQILWNVSLLLGLIGVSGATYIIIITRRLRRQASDPDKYTPVMEDWIWHTVLPFVAYAALFIGAIILPGNAPPPLFFIGAATVLLLFIGIHNSWDTVTFIAGNHLPDISESEGKSKSEEQKDTSEVS